MKPGVLLYSRLRVNGAMRACTVLVKKAVTYCHNNHLSLLYVNDINDETTFPEVKVTPKC